MKGEGVFMLLLNQDLFVHNNILTFIDQSTNILIANNNQLAFEKEYWLYYYIKEDFISNLRSLYNKDIDLDTFGFSFIRRNTRHMIEAFLDLYNLCNNSNYMTVLKYCAHISKEVGRYSTYLYKGQFTIRSKCNIAKEHYGE